MQMINSVNSITVDNKENLTAFSEIIKDDDLEVMIKEIDTDRYTALKKVYLTFIRLNIEQSHIFLGKIIPQDYTNRSYSEVLEKMLRHKYVRYLVSNRGYYDQFVIKCINIYESDGKLWEKEWKDKFIKKNKEKA
jgi:hypothetical protein